MEGVLRSAASLAKARLKGAAEYEQRLRRLLFDALGAHANELMCEREGIRWTLALEDQGLSKKIFAKGSYEQPMINAFRRFLTEEGYLTATRRVLVDVGANLGTPSIPLALALPELEILALEPHPRIWQLLVRNVAANGLAARIRCENVAVLQQEGAIELAVPTGAFAEVEIRTEGAQGFAEHSAAFSSVRTAARRIDALLESHQISQERVAAMWSDTQGSEGEVIASAGTLWEHDVPLFVELWPLGLERHGGLQRFLDIVRERFTKFINVDSLLAGNRAGEPISELPRLAERIAAAPVGQADHGNVILLGR